jgi:hypothetical protein
MKHIILFNSYVCTVKSVYRKKLRDGTIKVFLSVLETDEKFIFNIKNNNDYKFLKKSVVITVHFGNDGYVYIQEGNKLPKNGQIYYAEIKHIDSRINLRRKFHK